MNGRQARALRQTARVLFTQALSNGRGVVGEQWVWHEAGNNRTVAHHPQSYKGILRAVKKRHRSSMASYDLRQHLRPLA